MCYVDQEAYDATVEFMKTHNPHMQLPRWINVKERMPPLPNPRWTDNLDYWVVSDGIVIPAWLTLGGIRWYALDNERELENVTHWYEVHKPLPPREAIKTRHIGMKYQLMLITPMLLDAMQHSGDATATEKWAKKVSSQDTLPDFEFEGKDDSVNVTVAGSKVNVQKDSQYITWDGTQWGVVEKADFEAPRTIAADAKWEVVPPTDAEKLQEAM